MAGRRARRRAGAQLSQLVMFCARGRQRRSALDARRGEATFGASVSSNSVGSCASRAHRASLRCPLNTAGTAARSGATRQTVSPSPRQRVGAPPLGTMGPHGASWGWGGAELGMLGDAPKRTRRPARALLRALEHLLLTSSAFSCAHSPGARPPMPRSTRRRRSRRRKARSDARRTR